MMDHLQHTLRLWRTVPFKWGGTVPHVPGSGDCLLSIGEYCKPLLGFDWGSEFRGNYSTQAEALEIVKKYGGPDKLIDRSGMLRTDYPVYGDVVCIKSTMGDIAAICAGDSVVARLEIGVKEINRKLVQITASWSVPNV